MTSIRRALVTGASSGIGTEFARALAARGCDVVLVARRAARLTSLAACLEHTYGVRAETLTADLADPIDLAVVEARLADVERPVDLLVNNAGIGDDGPRTGHPADDQEQLTRVNVLAPLRLACAIAPELAARGRGGVINVASLAAMLPGQPGGGAYAASKAFLIAYSESLSAELKRHDVRVTVVCPGFVRTELTRELQAMSPPSLIWVSAERVVADALRGFAARRPLVVPGAQYKAADVALRLLPRSVIRMLLAVGAS